MFALSRVIRLSSVFLSFSFISFITSAFSSPSQPTICLTQIVAHPALDATRQGILDELALAGYADGKGARIYLENAQGQVGTALQIASKCKGVSADVIVALGTPMAQSALKGTTGTQIPLIFSSITDPLSAKLVAKLQAPGGRVSGVSNASSRVDQLALFIKICPNMKRLGVVLNPGDANSVAAYKLLEVAAKEKGVTLVQAAASKTTEVAQAAKSLASRVDALFVDNDNTALAGFSSIAKVTTSLKIPLFVSDTDMVPQGALAALGPDQYQLGRQTGQMIVRVLKGESPGQMDVGFPKENALVINESVAKKIGITFPKDVLALANKKNESLLLVPKRDNS